MPHSSQWYDICNRNHSFTRRISIQVFNRILVRTLHNFTLYNVRMYRRKVFYLTKYIRWGNLHDFMKSFCKCKLFYSNFLHVNRTFYWCSFEEYILLHMMNFNSAISYWTIIIPKSPLFIKLLSEYMTWISCK